MILTFKGTYGSTVDLHGTGKIQGYEFLEPPIEWRFLREGIAISDWIVPANGYVSSFIQ